MMKALKPKAPVITVDTVEAQLHKFDDKFRNEVVQQMDGQAATLTLLGSLEQHHK
jgi:hypothetical protein